MVWVRFFSFKQRRFQMHFIIVVLLIIIVMIASDIHKELKQRKGGKS